MKVVKEVYPDFIIVGGMRSGSSSVRDFLSKHKDTTVLNHEGNYFNVIENYQKGKEWYKKQFTKKGGTDVTFWGEKTVDYSLFPYIPQKIYKFNPGVKLIWIFRNPTDRTYSNYLHEFRIGNERFSFKYALKNEDKRIITNPYYGYKKRSIYHEQVERFLDYFTLDQMHFIVFEEMIKNWVSEMNALLEFLELERFVDERPVFVNKTVLPRFPKTLYCYNKIFQNKNIIWRFLWIINNYEVQPGYPPMDPSIRKSLFEYFKKHNEKLKNLINCKLHYWK